MRIYRKIWVEHFGAIPKDEHGRSYEIHHKDGNRDNNSLDNLICVSIEEHFRIHYEQGDLLAAAAIARRMKVSPEIQRQLNVQAGKDCFLKKRGRFGLSKEQISANCAKGARAHSGSKWYNNGVVGTRAKEHPGEGWVEGKLPCGSGMQHGTVLGVFWNNGAENKRSVECPGEGWVRGRLLNETQRKRRGEIAAKNRRAEWVISHVDGRENIIVADIGTWCLENNFPYTSVVGCARSGKIYKGYKIVKGEIKS